MARVPITEGIRRWAEYEGKDNEALRDLCDAVDSVHEALEAEYDEMCDGAPGLVVHPFVIGTDKEGALKPLEEASEVYGAWQILDEAVTCGENDGFTLEYIAAEKDRFADELADCVTACVNLATRYGIDLQAALRRVERHNRERGRYA